MKLRSVDEIKINQEEKAVETYDDDRLNTNKMLKIENN